MSLIGKKIDDQLMTITDNIRSLDDSEEILNHAEIRAILSAEWGHWYCTDLSKMWITYLMYAKYDFQREWEALTEEYKPLENYNKESEITDVLKRGNESNSSTLNSTSTTTNSADNTAYATSFESTSTEKKTGRSEVSGDSSTTTSGGDTITMSYADITDGDKTGHEISHHYESVKGNIGTMSSQEMATRERDLRMYHCKHDFIKRFVGRYCYYVGGGCEWR